MMKFSITQYGKDLDKNLYTWDEKTRTLSTNENNLVLDFTDIDSCTFKTGSDCIFKTGSDCTFDTGSDCTFDTGSNCIFKTGSYCTFDTGYNCTFDTGYTCIFDTVYDCTFDTGYNCIFKTGSYCTFDTGYNCIFKTGSDCTFDTGSDCTFDTGYNCTFDTNERCVLVRRDIFEFYDISNKQITTASYSIKGYIEDGYYILNGEKQFKAIIADGILSEVLNKRGNVYKVKNYGQDEISYLINDGDIYSHGKTIKEARESLIYKISNRDTSVYNDYTLDTVVSFEDGIKMYRVITGACEAGTRYFIENLKEKKKEYTVREIIDLTQGQYGYETFKEFLIKEKMNGKGKGARDYHKRIG